MQVRKVTAASAERGEVVRLYESAFPANERWGMNQVLRDETGISEMFSFFDGELFCGFVILLNWKNITHIIYFAVDDALRGKGYGTEALRLIREYKPDRVILVDIEQEFPGADNNAQRRRRKAFYERSGYTEAGVRYSWRGEKYEIMILGGEIDEKTYYAFWRAVYQNSSIFDGE